MALITLNYSSPTIGMHQNLTVILPEDTTYFDSSNSPKLLKTLILLHGLSVMKRRILDIRVLKDMPMNINSLLLCRM